MDFSPIHLLMILGTFLAFVAVVILAVVAIVRSSGASPSKRDSRTGTEDPPKPV